MRTPVYYLELARVSSDPVVLCELVRSPYCFVWRALAANRHTPPAALLQLSAARDSSWNDNDLLRLLAEHPRADRTVLTAVLAATAAKLAAGERPYVAVLALAERVELDPDEVRRLGTLSGASARLRRGIVRRLSVRQGSTTTPAR